MSEGCRNCYAENVAHRFSGAGLPYEGLVQLDKDGKSTGKWNGQIKFVDKHLLDPLKWKEPRRIFVNSMSDLFHENVTDEMRDKIFAVMALCPQHAFQILTKRPERMLAYLTYPIREALIGVQVSRLHLHRTGEPVSEWSGMPLPNVHFGVSVEDQKTANQRIPILLQTPAAIRFISAEPLLGAVNLGHGFADGLPILKTARGARMRGMPAGNDLGEIREGWYRHHGNIHPWVDWVIVGGESGPGARPMHPDWARSLRDQCKAAGVPFFFKQWGDWVDVPRQWLNEPFSPRMVQRGDVFLTPTGESDVLGSDLRSSHESSGNPMRRVGTKAAGCLLDGVKHHEFPAVRG